MSVTTELRFDGGANEHVARRVLPEGKLLRRVTNMRLTRDAELAQRPNYTALPTTTYSANALVAHDLASYGDRLVALGDQTGRGFPTDLFEFVSSAAAWRATMGASTSSIRLPPATDVRDIARLPDQARSVKLTRVAAVGNFVAVAYSLVSINTGYVEVRRGDTGQLLLVQPMALDEIHVVAIGSAFFFVGINRNDGSVGAFSFTPASSETLTSLGTVVGAGASVTAFHVAAVTGAAQFVVAVNRVTPTTTIARINTSGGTVASFSGPAQDAAAISVEASVTASRINFARCDANSGTAHLTTYDLAGGVIAGETQLFTGDTFFYRIAVVRHSGTRILMSGSMDTGGVAATRTVDFSNESNHGTGVEWDLLADAVMTTHTIMTPLGLVVGHRSSVPLAGTNCLILLDRRLPLVQKDQDLSVEPIGLHGIALSGDKLYWGHTVISNLQATSAVDQAAGIVSEVTLGSSARRQMAMLGNYLHIAGGLPLVYDGGSLFEIGFAERPSIISITQATSGFLTLLAKYSLQSVWEAVDGRGSVHRSAPSLVREETLTGANDELVVVKSSPHSLRRHPDVAGDAGASIRGVLARTVARGENLHLDDFDVVDVGDQFAVPLTVNARNADATLRTRGTIYITSQRPIASVAPAPCRYLWPGRERLINGGLPLEELWQQSMLQVPAEPVCYAPLGRIGFSGRVESAIRGVASFEETALAWTRQAIYEIPGAGPAINGQGEFQAARRIPSPTGLDDWRSLVESPLGIFFKGDGDKLLLLTRSREVIWRGVGELVRDTLEAFPVVTAAVQLRRQHCVVFACQNAGGTDGVLLIYDLRRGVWFIDTVGAVTALAEYDGRLAYVQAGVVFLQDLAPGTGAAPTQDIETFSFNFGTVLDWGAVLRVGVAGEYRADATVQLFFSLNDGLTWDLLETQSYTSGEYAVGQRIQLLKAPPTQRVDRFALRARVTGGSDSAGLKLNAFVFETDKAPGMTRAAARDTH